MAISEEVMMINWLACPHSVEGQDQHLLLHGTVARIDPHENKGRPVCEH